MLALLRNHFRIVVRNLRRSIGFTTINVAGLAVGITTCTFIAMYIFNETSYDKHYTDGARIFRMAFESNGERWVAMPAPVAAALKDQLPEVEQVTRVLRMPDLEKFLLSYEPTQKKFYETNGYYVDSTFFQVLDYRFRFGNKATALRDVNSIVLSATVAEKIFGAGDPVGKVLKVKIPFSDGVYTVRGVFEDKGFKSHIPAHMFLSMNNTDVGQWVKGQSSWATTNIFHTYLKLNSENSEPLEAKLVDFMERNGGAELKAAGMKKTLFLQSLRSIYLHSSSGYEIAPNGNATYLYLFGSVAAFLLLIACINFMNLSTARSEKRAMEVGVRKAVGAIRASLISQFLAESITLAVLALVVALLAVWLLNPVFMRISGIDVHITDQPQLFLAATLLTLFTGLLSGLYPALYLSGFSPVLALKGRVIGSLSATMIRKGLVVFQFTVSMALILCAVLADSQMSFMKDRNLGFNKDQKLIIPLQSKEAASNWRVLKDNIAQNAEVRSSAMASTYPGIENINSMLFYAEGKASIDNLNIVTANVDNSYLKTLGIPLISGRNFNQNSEADSNAVVLNETAVRQLGYKKDGAVGRKVYFEFMNKKTTMNVIGVVKDYHFEGLQKAIGSLALTKLPLFGAGNNYMIVDVNSRSYGKLISDIETLWKKINPGSPFEYSFLDKDFQQNYQIEERTSLLIRYFAAIGIFIACLGLFGLAAFSTRQRIREIGIRKVLGASAMGITALLSVDFLRLVLIAVLIGTPIAWWGMDRWLAGFAFRTEVSWTIFALAAGVLVLIAVCTIGYHTLRAAWANPVKSLKAE